MNLLYRIISHLSIMLIIILGFWGVFFYFAMMDEINDEVDDALETHSEAIITRALSGEKLPLISQGSNNQYFLTPVSEEYARRNKHISYKDSMIYIEARREEEPARILNTIFRDETGQYYRLSVYTPTIEKKDLKEAILYWSIFLYIGLLLIILLVNIWVYYTSTRPLYTLLRWLDSYKVGSGHKALQNPTKVKEFQKLNEAAEKNMQRAERVFNTQKQFIGNASHEIQTPIAICRNRIELLMEDETLSKKQVQELMKTYNTLEYITKLNKSLLLLSKIDNEQFVETEEIILNSLIKKNKEDFAEVYSHLNITLSVEEKGNFQLKANHSLVEILINNLLKNSYIHNISDGTINIVITTTEITFSNTGVSKMLDGEHIFDRFYQGSKKEGSTGLGLAIARAICDMNNLSISYSYMINKHFFSIKK